MDSILTEFTDVFVRIAAIAITAFVASVSSKLAAVYRSKREIDIAMSKNLMLHEAIGDIVKSVQQQYEGAGGEHKLSIATEMARRFLEKRSIELDELQIRTLIESAVFAIKR